MTRELVLAGLADLVDVRDVRMTQRRREPRFLQKSLGSARILPRGGQHFDRDLPAEPGVVGQVHMAHAAFAEARENAVLRDA